MYGKCRIKGLSKLLHRMYSMLLCVEYIGVSFPGLKHYYFTRKYSFSSSSLCRKPDLFLCLLFKVSIPNCMSLNTFYFLMAIRHGEIQMHLCFLQPCLYCVSVLFTVNIQCVYMYEYDSTIHQQMFSFVLDSV